MLFYKIILPEYYSFGSISSIVFFVVLLQSNKCAPERSDLAEKVRQLKDQSAKSYVLKLSNAKFREYIKSPIKNYSFVVLFAAMATHRQCSTCSLVHDEFELTAKSFRITHGGVSDRLFFGFVDFDQNAEIFRSVNVNSVPVVIYFPTKRKLQMRTDVFNMQRHGYVAESMTRWLIEKSGIEFRVIRPPLFFGTAGLLVLFFLGSIVIYLRCENFGILNNRTLWSIVAVVFCLLMTSGQIWNRIRGPPFLTRAPNGGFSYVHASSHGQFIGETYIVFFLNTGITVTMIILIDTANNFPDSVSRPNKVFPLLCVGVIGLLFNTLLAVFKVKASNYPYKGLL